MILKTRLSRIIAFIISCLLVGTFIFRCVMIYNLNMREIYERSFRDDVLSSESYTIDLYNMYDQLWAVSNIYLRYTDSKDKYTCSKEYADSINKALTELGLMDKDGKITIDNKRSFEYYASCGDRVITNTKKAPDELKGKYSVNYTKGRHVDYPEGVNWHYGGDKYWYTTNYGVIYFSGMDYLAKSGIVLYDFDTKNLKSYTDQNGVKVYYKTDGTTPLPENTNDPDAEIANYDAYNAFNPESDENVILPNDEKTEKKTESNKRNTDKEPVYIYDMSEVTDTDVFLFFDKDNRNWYKIDESSFKKYEEDSSDISIYIKPSDSLISEYEQYSTDRQQTEQDSVHKTMPFIPLLIAGGIIGILLLIVCGYNEKTKKFELALIDHAYTEISVLVIIMSMFSIYGIIFENGITGLREWMDAYYKNFDMGGLIAASMITAIYSVCLGCMITIVNRLKCRSFWKTSLTGTIFSFILKLIKRFGKKIEMLKIKQALKKDVFMKRFIIRTAAAIIIEIFALFVGSQAGIGAFVFFSLLVAAAYIILSLHDFAEIAEVSEQITNMNSGDYSSRIVPEKSPVYGMTNKLNNISDGIRSAVERQVKSERMKIELVTNVSHDLKTPLTSIISYINLLSDEEMSPAAKDYVSIISQKSDRLKNMVSDLFDLAKATSRTDMNNEKLDAVILTNQVIGDMADKIEKSGKNVKTDIQAESALVMADGKKLYRVLQNLIDNALKYSMNGTRIYVTLSNNSGYTDIAVKNISAEEMDFTPEEITERFARGDKSRTTEGNGLGLSIAKSFTEACGGTFEVVIDGDMFTAHVKLPLVK